MHCMEREEEERVEGRELGGGFFKPNPNSKRFFYNSFGLILERRGWVLVLLGQPFPYLFPL